MWREALICVALVAVTSYAVYTVGYQVSQSEQCERTGGVYVRTAFGFKCVDLGRRGK